VAADRPLWLRAVHRLEREVGRRVEWAVRSDTYFDLVATAKRRQAQTVRIAEGLSREWLHLFNLPAGTDIRRVREQLASMERKLTQITKELAELEPAQPDGQP
jgi:hypothetical protein